MPALALVGNWPLAAGLMIAERTGRAIRRPAVEGLLSHAGKQIGQGWVFGFNEALDQAGATVGPLITALILYLRGGYQHAFAVLLIPALLCLGTLTAARLLYRRPEVLEQASAKLPDTRGFSSVYWIFVGAGALIAAGFADFSLIAFHFRKAGVVSEDFTPVLYSIAMATGAVGSLVFGWLYDRLGRSTVVVAFFLSAFFAPFVFLGGFGFAVVGMLLWGLGMGAQDSVLKALLAGVVPHDRRSTGFGVFDTAFGIAWFAGSAAMGVLYGTSILGLIGFSVVLQLAALPLFAFARNRQRA